MTEAGGLIVAAIITGAVAILAALITAIVSFLNLIISKEQSVSEFRQEWIDALRKDIAIVVGRVTAIHAESIIRPKDHHEELAVRVKEDLTGFNRVIVRIRLRLNRDEKGEKEGPATETVLRALEELESIFGSAKPRFDLLQPLTKTLVDNAQVILKENWNRVRDGEPVYQRAKTNSWTSVKIFATIGLVAAILYGLHWLRMI